METLVFLHGWGSRPENFQPLLNSLKKKFEVIAPSLFDLTEGKDFTWKKFAANLNKLIGKTKLNLQFIFCGVKIQTYSHYGQGRGSTRGLPDQSLTLLLPIKIIFGLY